MDITKRDGTITLAQFSSVLCHIHGFFFNLIIKHLFFLISYFFVVLAWFFFLTILSICIMNIPA